MLSLTPAAGEHLLKLLDEAGAPQDAAARFVASPEGLTLHLDKQRPGDDAVAHDGRTVLLMDEQVSELLEERTLDLEEAEDGLSLTLQ